MPGQLGDWLPPAALKARQSAWLQGANQLEPAGASLRRLAPTCLRALPPPLGSAAGVKQLLEAVPSDVPVVLPYLFGPGEGEARLLTLW